MERCLLCGVARQSGLAATLDEEGGGEGVPTQDGQVQKTVPLCVHTVQITLVAHQCGSDSLVTIQQGQVKGDVPFIVTLIKSVR